MNKKQKTAVTIWSIIGAIAVILGLVCLGYGLSKNNSTESTKETRTAQSNASSDKSDKSDNSSNSDNSKIVAINKNTNVVSGILKAHFDSVRYETVKNKEENYTDAEYNMEGEPSKTLNPIYYRATVHLSIENVGQQAVDLSYGNRSIILDNGSALGADGFGSGNGDAFITSNDSIAPGTKLTTSIIILSNKTFSVNHPGLNFEDICNPNGDKIADGGVAKIQ